MKRFVKFIEKIVLIRLWSSRSCRFCAKIFFACYLKLLKVNYTSYKNPHARASSFISTRLPNHISIATAQISHMRQYDSKIDPQKSLYVHLNKEREKSSFDRFRNFKHFFCPQFSFSLMADLFYFLARCV